MDVLPPDVLRLVLGLLMGLAPALRAVCRAWRGAVRSLVRLRAAARGARLRAASPDGIPRRELPYVRADLGPTAETTLCLEELARRGHERLLVWVASLCAEGFPNGLFPEMLGPPPGSCSRAPAPALAPARARSRRGARGSSSISTVRPAWRGY